jgi:hypothetical protein
VRLRRSHDEDPVAPVPRPDRHRSEAGDTMVEVLIAIAVIAIAATAILAAFATSISGSGAQRTAVTMDTMLRTASAEVTSAIQQQSSTVFGNCSGAYLVNQSPIALPDSAYTATISGVQYWDSTTNTFTPSTPQTPVNGPCPSGANPIGPQQLTVQVTYQSTTQSITTVVQNPVPPTSSTCQYPASQLVWVAQPTTGNAGSALFPAPTVVLEDRTGCIVQNDASQINLSIASGPSGGTLNNCAPSGYGETSFENCSLSTIGTYTLQASDPGDGIAAVQSTSPVTITAGVAVQLVFHQQPGNGTGGTALTTQPVVWIEDSVGNVVLGDTSTVTLSIGTNPSGGTLSGCTSTTTNGVATFSGCKINTAGTGYTLTASDAGDDLTTASPPSSAFNITVGPASQLGFTTSPGAAVGGDAFGTQPVVSVEDAGGNTVTTNTSHVSLALGTNPSGGTLSGCTSSTSNGVASFSGCAINKNGNGYTLVATDGSLTSATSSAFNVVAPALTSFAVVPATNTPTAGSAFNVTITALDQAGYTFALTGSQTIAFSGPSNSPNNTAPAYPSSVTFSSGVGTASVKLYDAQTTTLTATQGAVTGTSGNVTVGALTTASTFSVANPGTQTAGTPFNETVTALDTYGNTVTTYGGNKFLTFSGPATSPSGTTPAYPSPVTFSGGVGTPSITLSDAQSTTLTVTQGSLSGTSTSFTVTAAPPSTFTTSNPGTQTAGTPFTLTLTAKDAYGNTVTSYSGPQSVVFSGPSNSPNNTAPTYPSSVTFSSGVGTASVTLYDAQSTSITASQGGASGTTNSFTVNGLTTTSAFSLSSPSPTAGSSFTDTVTATDIYGNLTSGYTGSKALVFTGPSNAPNGQAPAYPGTVTFTGGIGTATITLYDAQTTTLTATFASLTGTSGSFTVNPGALSKFTVSNPGAQTAGTPFNVTITALDAWNNTATTYSGSQAIAFSGPSNSPNATTPSYPGSVSFSNGVGTASVTLYDVQSTSLTATKGTATGNSGTFAVSAGSANSFTVSNPGTRTAGTAFNETLTALDAYGNTATGYAGPQSVVFSGPANSPNGTAPTYPSSVTFTNGVGTASVTLVDAQTTTLTATAGPVSGSSTNFTVNGTGTTTNFSLSTPSPTAGTAFNETITATDTYGNLTSGYSGSKTLVFTGPSNAPNGHVPTYPGTVTFTSGVGTASITLYDAQTTTLTATQSAIAGTSASFTVNPSATASSFTVSNPGAQTAGAAFNETITAFDAWGNAATGYTGSKAITFSGPSNSPSGHAPTYPSSVTFSNGVGTASVTLYDVQSTSLTATQGSATGNSGTFAVSAGSANSFTVANPGTRTAGTSFSETITALDTWGNTATGYSGPQTLTFSGPSNSPNASTPTYPSSVTFTSGVGTATVTLVDAQSTTLTATQGSVTGTSTSFTVSPSATAASFTVGNPGTRTAGTAFSVSVTALDPYGNTATGYSGSKTLTFSGPSNSPNNSAPTYPGSVTFTSGVGTPTITLVDAQSTTLTVTQGSVSGTSTSFTVNGAGTASSFTVSNPGTQTAGSAFNETITAIDAYGNTATGYTGSQTLTFSGPSNSPDGTTPSYPGSVTFAAGVGTASVTLVDAQSTSLTATKGSATGNSGSFTVLAAAQASLGLTNITVAPVPALTCTGPNGSLMSCTSTGENANTNLSVTAGLQLLDTYGNVVTNSTGSTITVALAASGNYSSFTPSTLTIANGQSSTSGQFTMTRSTGTGKSATMTAQIGGTTELTVNLHS